MEKKTREELKALSYAEKIDYYTHINDLISVNNGNHKTGIGCLTMSMPVLTCRPDAPCRNNGICYCMRGHQAYPNVCGAYHRNWRLWTENPDKFEEQLNAILTFSGVGMFRYNDAGEIPDSRFLAMMCRVAEKHPEVIFLAYTKKYEMINNFLDNGNEIPKNLTIRFSAWDKSWNVPNPYNLPMAYVDFKKNENNPDIPNNTFICPGNGKTTCSACKVCWRKNVKSVVFKQH